MLLAIVLRSKSIISTAGLVGDSAKESCIGRNQTFNSLVVIKIGSFQCSLENN
jgi:hypothetical protein